MRSTPIIVRWGELDPYNHVNHTVYLTYLETARIEALDSIGWGMDRLAAAGYMILVAELHLKFRLPGRGGDRLIVTSFVERISGAASHWRQEIHRDEDLLVAATLTGAITDLSGRPRRLPPELKEGLEELMAG